MEMRISCGFKVVIEDGTLGYLIDYTYLNYLINPQFVGYIGNYFDEKVLIVINTTTITITGFIFVVRDKIAVLAIN